MKILTQILVLLFSFSAFAEDSNIMAVHEGDVVHLVCAVGEDREVEKSCKETKDFLTSKGAIVHVYEVARDSSNKEEILANLREAIHENDIVILDGHGEIFQNDEFAFLSSRDTADCVFKEDQLSKAIPDYCRLFVNTCNAEAFDIDCKAIVYACKRGQEISFPDSKALVENIFSNGWPRENERRPIVQNERYQVNLDRFRNDCDVKLGQAVKVETIDSFTDVQCGIRWRCEATVFGRLMENLELVAARQSCENSQCGDTEIQACFAKIQNPTSGANEQGYERCTQATAEDLARLQNFPNITPTYSKVVTTPVTEIWECQNALKDGLHSGRNTTSFIKVNCKKCKK